MQERDPWNKRRAAQVATLLAGVVCLACGGEPTSGGDDIVIGAALPFTGERATDGQNLEQALLLAIEDVNATGGIDGRKLSLVTRDSNSGTERGLDALLDLLYVEEVEYLIGPEENALAREVVPDVDGQRVFNLLPGPEAPTVKGVGRKGAWLRLAPGPLTMGYGLAAAASELLRTKTTTILATKDDYNQTVSAAYSGYYANLYGNKVLRKTTLTSEDADSFHMEESLEESDQTLLLVNSVMAANLVTNFTVSAREVSWLLGPTLRTPGLLLNIPPSALDGSHGVSPALSLLEECDLESGKVLLQCQHDNADNFAAHYAARWDDHPFATAHFYYDAVLLLAMGLQYAMANGQPDPLAPQLQDLVIEMTNEAEEEGRWSDIGSVMSRLSQGVPVSLTGAANRYSFTEFGEAEYELVDVWQVAGQRYVDRGTIQLNPDPW